MPATVPAAHATPPPNPPAVDPSPVDIEVPLLGGDFAALQAAGGASQPPHSPVQHANLVLFVALAEWQCALMQAAAGQIAYKPIALPVPYPMPADRPWLSMTIGLRPEQYATLAMSAQSTDPARLAEILGGLIRDGVGNMKRAMTEIGRAV